MLMKTVKDAPAYLPILNTKDWRGLRNTVTENGSLILLQYKTIPKDTVLFFVSSGHNIKYKLSTEITCSKFLMVNQVVYVPESFLEQCI